MQRGPDFYPVVEPYLKDGNRAHLAFILRVWSPATDPGEKFIGEVLHRAISAGDIAAVQMLLDAGVSPTLPNGFDPAFTPLLAASDHGGWDMVMLFWQRVGPEKRFLLSCRGKESNFSCLVVAALNGHIDVVANFLDLWDGWTSDETNWALNRAAAERWDDVVSLLLERISYTSEAIQDALGRVVSGKSCFMERRRHCRQLPDDEETSSARQKRIVSMLIDAGASPNGHNSYAPSTHLIITAAFSGTNIGAMSELRERGADPHVRGWKGKTPIHWVSGSHAGYSVESLRLLLQYGASPEARDDNGEAPLHIAARMGTLEMVKLCLAHCPDPDVAVRIQNNHGESLLHYAAAGGNQDIVEFLLDWGLDINMATSNGWTPLMCALSPSRVQLRKPTMHLLVSFLLQRGANVNVVTDEGWTPLHALITHAAPPYYSPGCDDEHGQERQAWVVPLVRELISRGTPVDTESRVLLPPFLYTGPLYSQWGHQIRKHLEPSSTNPSKLMSDNDTTPLMWAMRVGAMGIFDELMAHFASTNARDAEEMEERGKGICPHL